MPQYTAAVKASDGTVSRRGGVAEFVNGNGGGFNHYSELKAYKPFYSRDLPSVAKWAKWRNDGIKQMCGNDCPFVQIFYLQVLGVKMRLYQKYLKIRHCR